MSQLSDRYEEETGAKSYLLMCHVVAATDEYVNWLEAKVASRVTIVKDVEALKPLLEQDKPRQADVAWGVKDA